MSINENTDFRSVYGLFLYETNGRNNWATECALYEWTYYRTVPYYKIEVCTSVKDIKVITHTNKGFMWRLFKNYLITVRYFPELKISRRLTTLVLYIDRVIVNDEFTLYWKSFVVIN